VPGTGWRMFEDAKISSHEEYLYRLGAMSFDMR
jgi:hypothetical protein